MDRTTQVEPYQARIQSRTKLRRKLRRAGHLFILTVFCLMIIFSGFSISLKDVHQPSFKTVTSPPLSASRKLFTVDQKPTFQWHLNNLSAKSHGLFGWTRVLAEGNTQVQAKVMYNDSPVNIPATVTQTTLGNFNIEIDPTGPIKPGRYTLQATAVMPDGNVTTQQSSFAWGVLAINTDQDTYQPGQIALIQMGALTADGHTICNADLSLSVTAPDGGVQNPKIIPSGVCHGDSYVTVPDYTANYQVGGAGSYKMTVRLGNGYELTDYFQVADNPDFIIKREGPTRVFPAASYSMKLTVTPKTDFSGTVSDFLEAGFSVVNAPGATVIDSSSKKSLNWQANWQAGHTYVLNYEFKVPPISPAFYFIGSLKMSGAGSQIYQEARRWQIANDATVSKVQDVTNTKTSTTSVSATITSTTSGNFLVVTAAASVGTGTTDTLSVTNNNTLASWVSPSQGTNNISTTNAPADAVSGQNSEIWLAYALNIPSGITQVTVNGTVAKNMALNVMEFSGVMKSGAADGFQIGNNDTTTSGIQTTPSITTSAQSVDLIVGAINQATSTATLTLCGIGSSCSPSGWTEIGSQLAPGSGFKGSAAWTVVNNTGTFSSEWTNSVTTNKWGRLIMAFKASNGNCDTATTDQYLRGGETLQSGTKSQFCWAI